MFNKDVIWSDEFVSGNDEIDCYHKQIVDGVVELYKMLDDTSKFKDEIPKLTTKIEEAMYEHMDLEINYLKEFDLTEWLAHEASHNFYKKKFEFYKYSRLPDVIRAAMTGELSRDYMREHFFKFDVKDIHKINEKLKSHE